MFQRLFGFRVDAYKLTTMYRRPIPRGAANIGTWSSLLNFLGWVAIATNTGLICFETDHPFFVPSGVNWRDDFHRLLIFIIAEVCCFGFLSQFWETVPCAQHVMFFFSILIWLGVPDKPRNIQDHLDRQLHLETFFRTHEKPEDIIDDEIDVSFRSHQTENFN